MKRLMNSSTFLYLLFSGIAIISNLVNLILIVEASNLSYNMLLFRGLGSKDLIVHLLNSRIVSRQQYNVLRMLSLE